MATIYGFNDAVIAAANAYLLAGATGGDVVGPASATDGAVVLFNGTTGKLVKDSTAAGVRTTLDAEQLGVSRGYRAFTSNDTLVLTDAGKLVASNMAGANTLTVPPNSSVAFAVGTIINFAQYGAGQTTVTAGSGVTIRSEGAKLKTNAQYAGGTLQKIGTDEWMAFGSLAT